jgi:hypothetical protein
LPHTAPVQLVEQHSPEEVQACPSTLQVPPPNVAQFPPEQLWVQHSVSAAQAVPTSLHAVPVHEPPVHWPMQQSVLAVQLAPAALQNELAVHTLFLQLPLAQHGTPLMQGSPAAMHWPPSSP